MARVQVPAARVAAVVGGLVLLLGAPAEAQDAQYPPATPPATAVLSTQLQLPFVDSGARTDQLPVVQSRARTGQLPTTGRELPAVAGVAAAAVALGGATLLVVRRRRPAP
jgi:LPXTG-motif cell wall-anchored protein